MRGQRRLAAAVRATLESLESRRLMDGTPAGYPFGPVVLGSYGTNNDGLDVLVQPDGKTVVAGDADSGQKDVLVARYRTDGTEDPGFGVQGRLIFDAGSANDLATAIDYLPDGRIMVAGFTGDPDARTGDGFVALLKPDGTLDPSFAGTGMKLVDFGGFDGVLDGFFDGATNRLYIGGTSFGSILGGVPTGGGIAVAALNLDGSFASGFGNAGIAVTSSGLGGVEGALAMERVGDGIVLAGFKAGISLLGGGAITFTPLVAKLDMTGTLVPGFGTGGRREVGFGRGIEAFSAVSVDPATGNILAAGLSADGGGSSMLSALLGGGATGPLGAGATNSLMTVARLTANGQPDSTFSSDGKVEIARGTNLNSASGIEVMANGKVVVTGGTQDKSTGDSNFLTARLNPDGTLDLSFGEGLGGVGAGTGLTETELGKSDGPFGMTMTSAGRIILTGHSKGAGSGRLVVLELTNDGLRALPGIAVNDISGTVESAIDEAVFTVSLTRFSDQPVSVNASVDLDNSTPGAVVPRSDTLTFSPGERAKPFSVDLLVRPFLNLLDRTVTVGLTQPVNGVIVDPTGVAQLTFSGGGLALDLSAASLEKTPNFVIGGSKNAKGTLATTVSATAAVKGKATVTVYGAPDGVLDLASNPVLGRRVVSLNLKQGKSTKLLIPLLFPAVTSDTHLTPVVSIEGAGVPTGRRAGKSSEASVLVQKARIVLNGPAQSASTLPAINVAHSQKFNVSIPLTNAGNTDATGRLNFRVRLISQAGGFFEYIPKSANIKLSPGKPGTARLSFSAPPATSRPGFASIPAGTYTLEVFLTSSSLAGGVTNETNNTVLATGPFILTQ